MEELSNLRPPPSPSDDWQTVAPSFERLLDSARPFLPAIAALANETTSFRHKQQLREILAALDSETSADVVFEQGRNIDPLRIEALDWRPEANTNRKRSSPFSIQEDLAASANAVVWRTIAYPASLTLALLGFALFMWTMVVPEMRTLFEDFALPLAPTTRLILNARPYILFGMVLCASVLGSWMFLPSFVPTSFRRTASFAFPWLGKIYRNAAFGKFCHVLAIMLGAGAPRDAAIRVAARATLPKFVVRRLVGMTRPGNTAKPDSIPEFIRPLSLSPIFDLSRVPQRLRLLLQSRLSDAERSTALRELAADFYFRSTDGSQAYLEPLVVLIAGLLVGLTTIGLFMPLVSLITNLSG